MTRRDRFIIRCCDLLMRLASDPTRARVQVALLRAQRRLVPADLERRADWLATWERLP